MMGVFDSLSDGILIVNKAIESMPEDELQSNNNLVFCNSKSTDLFKLKSVSEDDPIL